MAKYCQNCGNLVDDNAAFCTKCGAAIQKEENNTYNNYNSYNNGYNNYNNGYNNGYNNYYNNSNGYQQPMQNTSTPKTALVLGILGIVFSFFFALAGHILSIIGIVIGSKEKKTMNYSTGLTVSIVGEVLSVISSILGILLSSFYLSLLYDLLY